MGNFYLTIHNGLRWFLLAFLILTIAISLMGLYKGEKFSSLNLKVSNGTTSIAHLQVIFGGLLYIDHNWFQLPVKLFSTTLYDYSGLFFSIIHPLVMIFSVIILTLGNIRSKQQVNTRKKFITTLRWSTASLMLILLVVPWPFYSSVGRPILRFLLCL